MNKFTKKLINEVMSHYDSWSSKYPIRNEWEASDKNYQKIINLYDQYLNSEYNPPYSKKEIINFIYNDLN